MKASYADASPSMRKNDKHYWHGAVRDDAGNIVWECNHVHHNRDNDSGWYNTVSARRCGKVALRQMEQGETVTGKQA
jgi:hypothetical protein